MTYHEQLAAITDPTIDHVLAAVAAWQTGKLSDDELVEIVAAFIAAGNSAATVLADLSLAATLTRELAIVVLPQGLVRPSDDPERLSTAATTLQRIPEASLARWARLARAEVHDAATSAYSAAIGESSLVTGWVRGLEPNACELCNWWARDGRVWQPDHPMPTHKGCACFPIPTTTTTDNFQTVRQASARARERTTA